MRQKKVTPLVVVWVCLGGISLALFGCGGSDPAPAGVDPAQTVNPVNNSECLGAGGGADGINMVNYLPDCSQELCSYSSEYVYGEYPEDSGMFKRLVGSERGQYITKKESTDTIAYASGTLSGPRYVTRPVGTGSTTISSSVSMSSDGNTMKFLQFEGWWYSDRCDFSTSEHPAVWSFGTIQDGQIRDQNTEYCLLNKINTQISDGLYYQTVLTKIADVNLENGETYTDAVILYYLLSGFAYVDLKMAGIDTELNITLPTAAETNNEAIESFEVYARGIGWIAGGKFRFDYAKKEPLGDLLNFSKLTAVKCF